MARVRALRQGVAPGACTQRPPRAASPPSRCRTWTPRPVIDFPEEYGLLGVVLDRPSRPSRLDADGMTTHLC